LKNTLFRRATVGTFAAVAAVGLSTFFATAASAHSVGPKGTADCGTDGKYTITWTVTNDYETQATLTNVKVGGVPNSDAPKTLAIKNTPGASASFKTTHAGTTTGGVKLEGTASWGDGYSKGFDYTVKLEGTCKAPSTPPSTPPASTPAPSPSASKSVAPPRTPEASSSTPGLPVTGSSTTMPLVGTGAALIAGGAALVVTLRRRRRVTFTAE